MVRRLALAAGSLAILMLAQPATAEDAPSSIVGFWKMASFTSKVVETGQTRLPYGEHPGGYTAFSRNGNMVHLVLRDNRKAPAGPDLTDAERTELFKTMAAFSGTYKVEGNKIIFHYEATWIQSRTGTDDVRTFETSGKKFDDLVRSNQKRARWKRSCQHVDSRTNRIIPDPLDRTR